MGNGLIITGRALGLVGRSLVTDVGGAPCCCGGSCQCLNAPGCVSAVQSNVHIVRTQAGGQSAFLYGPVETDCCCKPQRPQKRTFTQTSSVSGGDIWELRADPGPYPLTIRRYVNGTFLDSFLEGGSPCLPPGSVSIPNASVHIGPPGIGNTVGYERITCDRAEGDARNYINGVMTARTTYAGNVVSDHRKTCVSPLCKTCCLPDGGCIIVDPAMCLSLGGEPGATSNCGDAPCLPPSRPTGRCCLPSGACTITGRDRCEGILQGTYGGDRTTCEGFTCPELPRACCLPGFLCLERTLSQCSAGGGQWFPNNHCGDPGVCVEQMGSCCTQSGAGATCLITNQQDCGTGIWTAGGTCANGDATCLGACCSPNPFCASGFLCADGVGQAFCGGQGGIWHGGGSLCANVADPGGCCNSGQLRGPIRIATGSETMAVTGGCASCGQDKDRL